MAKTTVPVQAVRFTDRFSDPQNPKDKYRVGTKSTGIIDSDKFVQNLVNEQHVPKLYAKGVLEYLPDAVFDYMEAGHTVQTPFGSFRISVSGDTVDDIKDCKATLIKRSKILFTPSAEWKQKLSNLGYSMESDVVNGNADDEEDDSVNANQPGQTQNPGNTNTNPTPTGDKVTVKWVNSVSGEVKSLEVAVGGTISQSDFPAATGSNTWNKTVAQVNAELASATAGSTITVTEQGDGF